MTVPWAGAQELVPAPGSDPARDYLDAIAGAEAVGGAYAIELVDLYHGLGQALLKHGEFDEARDAYHRAAMVARVNFGPYSLEQSDYLYSIADIEFRLGNAEAAAEALDHIYRIHARQYGENDPAMLPAVQDIHAWYVNRLASGGVPIRPSDYQNLSFLVGRIAFLTEARYGLESPRTALNYRALGQAHYRAIRHMVEAGKLPAPELVMSPGEADTAVAPDRSFVNHLVGGEEALTRAVESWQANPDGSALEVAEALAQIGDWNLALGFDRAAKRNYEEAYRVLTESDEFGFLAGQYLGTPTPLRLMNTTGRFLRTLDPPEDDMLEISMTVTPDGRLHDIRVMRMPPDTPEEQAPRIEEQLKAALFRPAVVNGEVLTSEAFVWHAPARLPEDLQAN